MVVVVAAHREPLGRVNTELAGAAFCAHSRHLIVVDDRRGARDQVGDVIGELTSLCARLYGRGLAGDRLLKAAGCARHGIKPRTVAGAGRCGGMG